ncbi:hypothetical protein SO802_007083 [Lithocarpus litseifolius]|uniref:BHLH domain-containing protein n=1 Tax=Lithocarpus litseifolius TaxID=425828 RepID=A0AAW2DRM8_9ROSI
MALSFCSNWDMTSFQPELAADLLSFDYNLAIAQENYQLGSHFEQPDESSLYHVDSYSNLLPYFSAAPSDNLITSGVHSPEMFLLDESYSYQYPKRQRTSTYGGGNYYYSNFTPGFYDGYVPNPGNLVPESMPEVMDQFLVSSGNYGCGSSTSSPQSSVKKPLKVSLSAQSIAARERRRKITEKTQELGKLIPGGHRLNTAEMFHAAFNYVKFLQAQASVLQLIGSIQEIKEEPITKYSREELQALIASPIIQEKLSSEEKCLVPKEFLQILADDKEVQLKPFIVKDIDQLLQTKTDGRQ